MAIPRIADPGGEVIGAPPGSKDWAERWRLEVQGIVKRLSYAPEKVEEYFRVGLERSVWTLLTTKSGQPFRTFEAFCEYEQPWGLGMPRADIDAYLAVLHSTHGKRAVDLFTVPDAQDPPQLPPGPGRGHKAEKHEDARRPLVLGPPSTTKEKNLRAILRGPVEVQDLFRADLISEKLAAKFGPLPPGKRAKQERKARYEQERHRIVDIVQALRDVPRDRKVIDAAVCDMLGAKPDPYAQALRLALRLSPADRQRLRAALDNGIEAALAAIRPKRKRSKAA